MVQTELDYWHDDPNLLVLQNDKEKLRLEFFANHNHFKRKQFFDKHQGEARKNIQENFYDFLRKTKQNIHFFDWYESQTTKESAPELKKPVQNLSKPASSMSKPQGSTLDPIQTKPKFIDLSQTESTQKPLDISINLLQTTQTLQSSHKPSESIDPLKSNCDAPTSP